VPKKGLIVEGKASDEIIRSLLAQYIIISQLEGTQNKATEALVNIRRQESLVIFAIIQRCIDHSKKAQIKYKSAGNPSVSSKVIEPLLLFERENCWRLIANENSKRKQFVVEKIISAKETEQTFIPPDKGKLKNALDISFGAWIDDKSIPVTILFSRDWLYSGKLPHLMKGQENKELSDGSIMVSFKVSYLEDLARWIVARGGEVIALEPKELRKRVKEFAEGVLKRH
jgi:predicted DNA-binding transcriptional regulator YafY